MRDRIKKLRKMLDLTQSEFAARIGSTQNNIANYETGRRSPSAAALNNICKEFKVNEEWLRTGNGEMFKASPSDALDVLSDTYHLTHSEYILIEKFVNMKPESRQIIIDYIIEVAAAVSDPNAPADPYAPASSGAIDIGAEVVDAEVLYEKSLGFAPNTASSASNTTDGTESDGKAAGNT